MAKMIFWKWAKDHFHVTFNKAEVLEDEGELLKIRPIDCNTLADTTWIRKKDIEIIKTIEEDGLDGKKN